MKSAQTSAVSTQSYVLLAVSAEVPLSPNAANQLTPCSHHAHTVLTPSSSLATPPRSLFTVHIIRSRSLRSACCHQMTFQNSSQSHSSASGIVAFFLDWSLEVHGYIERIRSTCCPSTCTPPISNPAFALDAVVRSHQLTPCSHQVCVPLSPGSMFLCRLLKDMSILP